MDIDEFVRNPLSLSSKRRRKAAVPDEYDPGMLSKITNVGTSGLSALGNVLDLPGSVVRDALAGENPIDQLAPWNWTSSEGRTTGRDLLRKNRLIGKNDTWGNWAGGVGLEIATDPLTYLTLGGSALTKAGKLAKAAGKLDDVTKFTKVGPWVGRMKTTLEDIVSGVKSPTGDFAEGAASNISARRSLERAAEKSGQNLDELYDMPLGGLAAPVGPFAGLAGPTGVWGKAGGVGEKIAGAMDTAGRKVSESAPGRFSAMVFDHTVRGLMGKEQQKLARMLTTAHNAVQPQPAMEVFGQSDALDPALRQLGAEHGKEIMAAAQRKMVGPAAESVRKHLNSTPELQVEANKHLTKAMESFSAIDEATHIRQVSDEIARSVGEVGIKKTLANFDIQIPDDSLKSIETAVEKIKTANASKVEIANSKGANIKTLDEDTIGHLHRSVDVSKMSWQDRSDVSAALEREAISTGVDVKQLPEDVVKRVTQEVLPNRGYKMVSGTVVDTARSQETRNVSSKIVNDMLNDPDLRWKPGTPEGQATAAQHILDKYVEHLDPKYVGRSKPGAAYDVSRWAEKNKGRPGFAEMLERQTQLLNTPDAKNAVEQHAWELAQHVRTQPRRTRYTKDVLSDQMRYNEGVVRKNATMDVVHHYLRQNAGEGVGVPLDKVFRDADMDPETAIKYFASQGGLDPAAASHMTVAPDVANAIASVVKTQPGTEWGNAIGGAIDWANDAVRKFVTVPFPAFHARNFTSGQYVNLATGAIQNLEDLKLYRQAFVDAKRLRKTPDDLKWREIEAHRVHGGRSGERGTGVARGFEDVPYMPDGKRAVEELPMFMQNNPLLSKVGQGYQKAMDLGDKAMEQVEFYNRVPLFLYFRKKGYEPLQAALEVKKRQFNYAELSPAEKTLFRRGFLFYSFSRKMAPLMAETLMQRPGGALAQSIMATGKLHDQQDKPVPGYIKETTAIPLKDGVDGSIRYVTGIGLPYEDMSTFAPSPVQELLSRATPLIKAPIELATGQSMFQRGRPLDELDPNIGRTISNVRQMITGEKVTTRAKPFGGLLGDFGQQAEFALANSPASRLLSTARGLTDPRKSLVDKVFNYGTGVKITDVSPAAQDAEIGQRAAEIMKRLGARSFTTTYVPKSAQAEMTPEELQMLSGLKMLQRQKAQRAKERAMQ